MQNECDARFVINTQELIAAIYASIDHNKKVEQADRANSGNHGD